MSLYGSSKLQPDRIKHIFVIMLENRSFDHLLGFSNLQGIDAVTGQPTTIEGLNPAHDWNLGPDGKKVVVSSPADWAMPHDPGHEFPNVEEQLCGVNGFPPCLARHGQTASLYTPHRQGAWITVHPQRI